MSTRDLIDAIAAGDSGTIQTTFESEMMFRIADRMDAKRVEVARNMFGESLDEATAPNKVHPNHLHVSDAGGGKYKVHAVGKNFADGIKVGEHLSDTELDDFSEMGGKVKHVKPVKEATDTETKDKSGKVISWKHEGDWKKDDKKQPEGKVAHMSDMARRKTEKLAKEDVDLDEGRITQALSKVAKMVADAGDAVIQGGVHAAIHSPSNPAPMSDYNHIRPLGKMYDKITKKKNDTVKEDTEFTLEDFSVEDLEDFMMSEEFEQLDELSKSTLVAYTKKAAGDIHAQGMTKGKKQAQSDEVDRYTNQNGMKNSFKARDTMKDEIGANFRDIDKVNQKATRRYIGIHTAVDKLANK